ncbi:hypothetical protein BJ322DRAFT_339446 [Thelephora terrestris]|uniref:Uncharacterized protein n=1 Tax=Thelephora terrestris TaxID=56493 RepID=A0A9P6H5A3_9AGAM|nr:hypothetical protein BJ322DRAFT_339446 [Thelephora terrestris]
MTTGRICRSRNDWFFCFVRGVLMLPSRCLCQTWLRCFRSGRKRSLRPQNFKLRNRVEMYKIALENVQLLAAKGHRKHVLDRGKGSKHTNFSCAVDMMRNRVGKPSPPKYRPLVDGYDRREPIFACPRKREGSFSLQLEDMVGQGPGPEGEKKVR